VLSNCAIFKTHIQEFVFPLPYFCNIIRKNYFDKAWID